VGGGQRKGNTGGTLGASIGGGRQRQCDGRVGLGIPAVDGLTMRHGSNQSRALGAFCGAALAAVALVGTLPPLPPRQWGGGYGPSAGPPSVGGGGFSTIVASQTLKPDGGTRAGVRQTAQRRPSPFRPDRLRPWGPGRALGRSTWSSQCGKGSKVIADFSVTILDPTEWAKVAGRSRPPITVTSATRPSGGDVVVVVTTTGELIPVPGAKVLPGVATAPLHARSVLRVVQATTVASPVAV